jgi:hypothetical protein
MDPDVTQLLNALEQGDSHAAEELLPLVYQELRKLAAQRMAQEQPGQTLQPTAKHLRPNRLVPACAIFSAPDDVTPRFTP